MKKNVLALIIAGLLVASTIAGCSSKTVTNPDKPSAAAPENKDKPFAGEKIKVLIASSAQAKAQEDRTKEFTEKTGIQVEFLYNNFGTLLDKITAEGVAGTGFYDIIQYLDSWGASLKQFLIPITDRVTKDNIDMDRYPKAYQVGSTYDGQIYGLPVRAHPQMLFYRKDIFEKLGLKPPTTWEELEKAGKVIAEKTDLKPFANSYGLREGQNLNLWGSYLWSNGGDIFDDKWKPRFNDAKGIEATQRYIDLLLKQKIAPPDSVTWTEGEVLSSMQQNKSAMTISWWWMFDSMNGKSAAKEVAGNIGFAPVPQWEDKGKGAVAISMPLSIMKASKHKDAAWEFIKWITEPEVERGIVMDSLENKLPSDRSATILMQTKNLKDEEINKLSNGFHKVAAESLENARTFPMIPEWPKIVKVLETAMNNSALGAPVKETFDKAAKDVEAIMEKYYK